MTSISPGGTASPPHVTHTAAGHGGRPRIPLGETLTSVLGMGPMPFTKIVRCHALVGEARRIGRDRPADAWTHSEDSLRGAAERRADAWVRTEAGRTVEPAVATIKGLHAEARFLGHQLASLHERRYVGPHGESYTTAEAHGRHADWAARVEDEERAGSRAHRRIPPRAKKLLLGLLALDVIVLTFLMAKFLNVDLRRALLSADSVLRAVTALLFGILGTVGVALTMKLFGRRHRAYRAAHGGWDLAGGGSSRGGVKTLVSELLLCGLLALALGAAMAWRLVLDGPSDQRLLTGVMAALFALVIGAVAYLSYQSEFADGSTTTEAIDVLAPQLHGTHRTEEALRAKREILLRQAARLTARLARDCARLRAEAERRVVESTEDRAVRYARSVHQHCGYGSALPGPRLSLGDLDLALAQARSWTDTEAVPAVAVGGEGQGEQGDEGLAVVA
ncbi:putative membrane protein [Streptomyces scabiei 87.22]|uniref:Putative membrane protein n=2 Tax=Streptomyces scabiei TaxID=1930 RepID=C9YUE6_STRSW|nr:hypothetical protein [Streptomyces scabiei]MDX2577831.1 hypothetical protein [Streptomyces scabiei]MDX2654345.1 hypothetical protein [Streptomyces scabiei]MDX2722489.1 hypothetical protein [Streptomyces scabiei]MDX2865790.1 hypothetical protein [Streptomyces scabiei]MDX2884565.1 hypothetical protein [Streptomyces scabiei]